MGEGSHIYLHQEGGSSGWSRSVPAQYRTRGRGYGRPNSRTWTSTSRTRPASRPSSGSNRTSPTTTSVCSLNSGQHIDLTDGSLSSPYEPLDPDISRPLWGRRGRSTRRDAEQGGSERVDTL